ncbi:hypothetical protein SAMN04489761_0673 [Tenacibaculum sp. MAR_2009_124]|uniref:hypothetical protein n=1 Tax=Tenacibaculum sp. MAR_2009_124 TaxID=1250059 RepID=UPI0008943794|nr:hypothetical protein [Tenacibaculum sp. MAR_2009_124]SEB43159.1 hypothetical protein SAMN04489761_0673 [Tenacibaculum sp. MAR_2009_124]
MKFKLKKPKIAQSDWVSFILTLVATLFGVLMAIWLTNSEVRKKEKEDTIKLLQTSKRILNNTFEYSENLNEALSSFEKDTINYTKESIVNLKTNNPIPYPDLLEGIVVNELVSRNISEYSHGSIYNCLINLRKLSSYETVEYYLKTLEEMMAILNLEIELLNGRINSQELEPKLAVIREELDTKYSSENVLRVSSDK